MFRYIVLISVFYFTSVDSARILGLFPVPSVSHQVVFRALTTELSRRGHELVVMTTNPVPPEERPANYTEIDVSFAYQLMMQAITGDAKKMYKRGVILESSVHLITNSNETMLPMLVAMIEHPEVKKYTSDKNQHFDLIIAEAFMNYHLIAKKIFDAPLILFSSFHGLHESFEAIGAPARHPILYPAVFSDLFDLRNIADKFKQLKFEYDLYSATKLIESDENEFLKKNYGSDAPTGAELRSQVDLFLINSHPIFCGNRPLPPNAVYVGPLHMKPLKDLPQDLKTYLDNSKTGVIYVSLGTNVRPSMMEKDLLDSFLDAFKELPYDILWKVDADNIENIPKNVKAQKWFPQRDLLVHSNVKLFVMQGGLQSTDEAIDAGVPLVGIPMLGDQWYNINKYVELGIGVKVDAMSLNKESLLHGINTVLNDDSYCKNMKKLKKIMQDQPQSPLEKAVWWTEYVIRHGGAKHLQFKGATMSWGEYFMVDVLVPVVGVLIVGLVLVCKAVKILMGSVKKSSKVKTS